jgi:outer membrane protein assembly factor BamB
MSSTIIAAAALEQPQQRNQRAAPPRIALALVMVGLFWLFSFVLAWMELPTFVRFLSRIALSMLLLLCFTLWWLLHRGTSRRDRLVALGTAIAGGLGAVLLGHESLGETSAARLFGLMMMAPGFVFPAWVLWLLVSRRMAAGKRRLGLLAVLLLTSGVFTLIRLDGLSGEQEATIYWRWSRTAEDLYAAEREREEEGFLSAQASRKALRPQPGDWTGFRGPNRDSVVHGVTIATDWNAAPPRRLWRRRIGPAWSSVVIVDDRLFTQEQRRQAEAVVCLDAATGQEVWAHLDRTRFQESVSGAGPRATPTFADGRLYTLGATGILNCLDAATGKRLWFHDLVEETQAKVPLWGFCSSPLVVKGVVIVFAGGEDNKGLLAYRADTGKLSWTAAAGSGSYSSPQPASFADEQQQQVLFFSDHGLTALDPATGDLLWEHVVDAPGAPRSIQPHLAGKSQVLIASETDLGTALIEVRSRNGRSWTAAEQWSSWSLKPSFNDFVVHEGFIYGFDGRTFCCVDVETGERRWRKGRYDHGQVLLLAEQGLLLVVAENGTAILLRANPQQHEELSRFQAIKGKTWNHPVLVRGRLYVRNAEEIACYELASGSSSQ